MARAGVWPLPVGTRTADRSSIPDAAVAVDRLACGSRFREVSGIREGVALTLTGRERRADHDHPEVLRSDTRMSLRSL
jgi:hypothetical protein